MPDKRRERFYLEILRRVLVDAPSSAPIESESPDFLFLVNGRRLGVELTDFYLPPKPGEQPHQEWQSLKDQIVARAERLHAEAGGVALYVEVVFDERERLRQRDIRRFARQLADAVLAHPVPQRFEDPAVEIVWGRRPAWTSGIHVMGSSDGVERFWNADWSGWMARITSKHVSDEIKRKAGTEPLARTRCDELWLVIVNSHFSLGAPADISDEALSAVYEAPFDRIIWLLPHVPKAIDLQVARPGPINSTEPPR